MSMKQKTSVSIIVPVYNTSKYIVRCISSILCQLEPSDELILVDDGSSDGSGQICEEFSNSRDNVKTIHIPNSGVSVARNIGIQESKSEWIWFVDSDDWITESSLQLIKTATDRFRDALYWGFAEQYKSNGAKLNYTQCKFTEANISNFVKEYNPSMVFQFLFKRDIIIQNDIWFTPGVRYAEDIEFLYKYLSCISSVFVTGNKLYNYFIHNESVMRCNPDYLKISEDTIGVLSRLVNFWRIDEKETDSWKEWQFKKRFVNYLAYLSKVRIDKSIINKHKRIIKELFNLADAKGLSFDSRFKLTLYSLRFTLIIVKFKINGFNVIAKRNKL